MLRHLLLLVTICAGAFIPASSSHPFGFEGVEVYLSSFSARAMRVADINQDGLPDVVLLNNEKGRIDLHLQRGEGEHAPKGAQPLHPDRWNPVLEDARFERTSIVMGGSMSDSLIADVNLDGHTDLVVTDQRNRARVFHGPITSGWRVSHTVSLQNLRKEPDNVIWDEENAQILVLGEDSLQSLTWDPRTEEYQARQLLYLHAPGQGRFLRQLDINSDGLMDLIYEIADSDYSLGIHLGQKHGGYGNVLLPHLDPRGQSFEISTDRTQVCLLSIHPESRVIQKHVPLERALSNGKKTAESFATRILPFESKGYRDYDFHWGDFDTDGKTDLIARVENKPEVLLKREGNDRWESFPVPAGCEWMLHGDFTGSGRQELLFCNADKGFLGWSVYQDERIQFPRYISNDLEWINLATVNGDEKDQVLAIVKKEKKYEAHLLALVKESEGLLLETVSTLPLPDIGRDPARPLVGDFDGDGTLEWMYCYSAGSPFFLRIKDNKLHQSTTAKGFSHELLYKKKPESFMQLPPHSLFPSLLVLVDDEVGQFLQIGEDGTVSILDQINLAHGKKLAGLLPLGNEDLAMFDAGNRQMEIHRRNDKGTLTYRRSIPLPPLDHKTARLSLNDKHEFTLWILGESQLSAVSPKDAEFRMSSSPLFETELDSVSHSVVMSGDFNGDEEPDLLCIDLGRNHLLEIARNDAGTWTSAMHFQIFEAAQNYQGRRGGNVEPREMLVSDVNADGLDDIVLLVHDRLLVYIQDPVPDA